MEAPLLHLALVGTPNSGKTSLFNALTGSRQKVANYPGVTVERKEGFFVTPLGRQVSVVDLPGTYSLRGRSPDEEITRDFVLGKATGEIVPDLVLCVADSTNLRLTIRLLLELKRTGRPMILVLNMFDIATRRGITVDVERLAKELGVPVVTSIAVRKGGTADLLSLTDEISAKLAAEPGENNWRALSVADLRATQREADRIIADCVSLPSRPDTWTARIDAVVLHPVGGLIVLAAILFVMFQAVFAWAQPLMELLNSGFDSLGEFVHATLPAGLLQSFLQNGVISGVGSVHRVPSADYHHLPVYPAAGRFRLHGARRVPDGPHHGRRRPARPRLHSAAVELRLRHPRHHGDARDRQQARPADHDPDRAADDLLGAHSRLHADHLRLHSGQRRLGLHQPPGPRDVRPLRCRHHQRAAGLVSHQILHAARLCAGAVHAGAAGLQDAAAEIDRDRRLHAGPRCSCTAPAPRSSR
ncbi:GTP-binding protein EngB required for normal cell division [Bradyrhizobium sp. GM6.1]